MVPEDTFENSLWINLVWWKRELGFPLPSAFAKRIRIVFNITIMNPSNKHRLQYSSIELIRMLLEMCEVRRWEWPPTHYSLDRNLEPQCERIEQYPTIHLLQRRMVASRAGTLRILSWNPPNFRRKPWSCWRDVWLKLWRGTRRGVIY